MPSYLFMLETDDDEMIMRLENADGDILRFLDEEEMQFHSTPYLKRKLGEIKKENACGNEDWEDDNFKVIQNVMHIKTRCGLVMDDEQDTDMEQLHKKLEYAHTMKRKGKQWIEKQTIFVTKFLIFNLHLNI